MVRFITYKGKTRSVEYWAKLYGLHPDTVRSRLDSGWTIDKALNTPVKDEGKKKDDHKKTKCAKCKYAAKFAGDRGIIYCDYYCKHWDETGEPHRRPCPADNCTVYKKKKKERRKK